MAHRKGVLVVRWLTGSYHYGGKEGSFPKIFLIRKEPKAPEEIVLEGEKEGFWTVPKRQKGKRCA